MTSNPFPKPTDDDFALARRQIGWTDTRTAVLKWTWGEGLSCSQIAARLTGISSNAVIGKLHRLKVVSKEGRQKASAPRTVAAPVKAAPKPPRETRGFGVPVKPATPPRKQVGIAGNGMTFEKAGNERPPREVVPERIEAPGTATVLTLGAHMCKWPIGDPSSDGFTFCGRRKGEVGPYCREHALVAYQQPQPGKKVPSAKELARSLRRYI